MREIIETACARGAEREVERASQACFVSVEPSVGLAPTTLRWWPVPKPRIGRSANCTTQVSMDSLNFNVILSIKILWHCIPQSWHAYYLISDHFSTQLSGTEEFLTKILMKVLPGNRNRNMVQGSCFYFISQRENGEENQKGKVTYLGLLNMNWFSWYYQWVWLVAFKWYLEKCNLHLTCKDTWTTCSRMHGSFILRSAGFRIRHLILAWVLSGAIPIHPWYPICQSGHKYMAPVIPYSADYISCISVVWRLEGENHSNKLNHVGTEFLDSWKIRWVSITNE